MDSRVQRTVVIVIGKKSTEYKENLNGIENLKIVCLRRLTLRLNVTVTVTVTEEFVVRPLQLVRWRITHQIVVFKTLHKRKKTSRS